MFDYFFRGFAKSPVYETTANDGEMDGETDEETDEEGQDCVIFGEEEYFAIVSENEENELEF